MMWKKNNDAAVNKRWMDDVILSYLCEHKQPSNRFNILFIRLFYPGAN